MAKINSFIVPQKIGEKNTSPIPGQVQTEVNTLMGLQVLSMVESASLSLMYGTGVKAAEINQKGNKAVRDIENKDLFAGANPNSIYSDNPNPVIPDANPDGLGGFSKTTGWGGYMSSSLNGMPVMCRLKIVGTTYVALDGTEVTIPDIIFETVIITLKKGKNIEKTILNNSTGTVKEYIGNNDWVIEIRAIITASAPVNSDIEKRSQDGSYPIENMEAIMLMINAPISLKVECWFLNKLAGIEYITIEDGTSIDQIEGEYEMQRLIIPALSDYPLIITIAK